MRLVRGWGGAHARRTALGLPATTGAAAAQQLAPQTARKTASKARGSSRSMAGAAAAGRASGPQQAAARLEGGAGGAMVVQLRLVQRQLVVVQDGVPAGQRAAVNLLLRGLPAWAPAAGAGRAAVGARRLPLCRLLLPPVAAGTAPRGGQAACVGSCVCPAGDTRRRNRLALCCRQHSMAALPSLLLLGCTQLPAAQPPAMAPHQS